MRDLSARISQLSPVKRALLELEVQSRNSKLEQGPAEPIAVIGVSCRFPGGAGSPEAFWRLLREGVDAITEVPADRWDLSAYYDPNPAAPGRMYTRWGGFLPDVATFDAQFFAISPREAETMDPQQRLLLEVSWEALENAAQAPDRLARSQTGVFVGISTSDYLQTMTKLVDPARIDAYMGTGTAFSVAAGRLSYILGLNGPSMAVDTACSSSLVTVHLACQSLRARECDLALAGGVNVILSPEVTVTFSKARMMAADGRCKTFDAAADGYVRGEGCGVLVLKRLSEAVASGDHIHAVIRGSAVNQDGRTTGLTAPNGPAQQDVIRKALRNAGVDPGDVSYVEAHGTGTPLGDPIELQALAAVFGHGRAHDRPVAVGSVKTNIGHAEAAAGVAGLIKVILALQHREIPPHLHLRRINPHIAEADLPVTIPTELAAWPSGGRRRIAGVSSFGFSGTNAHVVLEEAPAPTPASADCRPPLGLLTLSAKNRLALGELARRFEQRLAAESPEPLEDVCFSANVGRAHFAHRVALIAGSRADACVKLERIAADDDAPDVLRGQISGAGPPKVAFLFTGQGAQYAGMGRGLYETQPTFRAALDRCDALLRAELEQPLGAVLFPADGAASLLDQTAYTQPALFALEYALAELWRAWGIEPSVVMGHSVGEYAAACAAGVFGVEDGLRLVAARGRLMQALPGLGVMAVVFGPPSSVADALLPFQDRVSIAAVNGPENTVIAGEAEAVHTVLRGVQSHGLTVQLMTASHAFHSPLMEPLLDAFEDAARQVKFEPLRVPLVSNVTGQLRKPGEVLDAAYWRTHIRQAVQFADGVQTLGKHGCEVFVEIGPHPVLLGMARALQPGGTWLPSLKRQQDDWHVLLTSVATMYVKGLDVDWEGFHRDHEHRRIALPTYPFKGERHWLTASDAGDENGRRRPRSPARAGHSPLGGHHSMLAYPSGSHLWESEIDRRALPYLDDHRTRGASVLPAAAYVEMALEAGVEAFGPGTYTLREMEFREPVALPETDPQPVQLIISRAADGDASFRIYTGTRASPGPCDAWTLRACGKLRVEPGGATADGPEAASLEAVQRRCAQELGVEQFYLDLRERGYQYGPLFQGLERLWRSDGEALGALRAAQDLKLSVDGYRLHPALLEAGLQVVSAALPLEAAGDRATALYHLRRAGRIRAGDKVGRLRWSHARVRNPSADSVEADIRLYDEAGNLAVELLECRYERASGTGPGLAANDPLDSLYELHWQPLSRLDQGLPRQTPSYIPPLRQICERVRSRVAQLSAEHGIQLYQELVPELDRVSRDFILGAFRQLGWQWQPGERFSLELAAARLGAAPAHRQLVGRLLAILEEDGLVRAVDSAWEVRRAPEWGDPRATLARLLQRYPACEPELTLIGLCGPRLADVLRGDLDPLQLLFPEGSLATVEALYQDSPLSRVYNGLIQEAIATALADAPADRTARILEIGAGTGGTTAYVLRCLRADRTEYVHTDVSNLFVANAGQKFRAYPFVRSRPLDIEIEPGEQGFATHQFDIVLAANVLHATASLRQTLAHVRALLAPGGLLVVLEGTRPQRWADLVFGLTEGWWRFADAELRPSYPLLPAERWRALLAEAGFTEVEVVPRADEGVVVSEQAVFLARAPDVDRPLSAASSVRERPGTWLVFADGTGIGRELGRKVESHGGHAIVVSPGPDFRRIDAGHFQIRPGCQSDMAQLLAVAPGSHARANVRGVVHLWSLDTRTSDATSAAALEAAQAPGALTILHLVQELSGSAPSEPPCLWLVTRGAQPVEREPRSLEVAQAPLWGFGRVIAREHPALKTRLVDLDPDGSVADASASLWEELRSGDNEDQLAFRHGQRYVARMRRRPRSPAPVRSERWRADGSYLISGGLGALGLEVARWAVEQGARRLILMGRTKLPPRPQWTGVDAASPLGRKIAAVRELEALGASVHLASVDVADETQLRTFWKKFSREGWPPIRGVVHLAGVVEDRLTLELDADTLSAVVRPKMLGAWALHRLLADAPLDFFILFSSAGSLLGPPGQGNYAAANAFLDALAHYRRAHGRPALSVNWGAWAELGFATAAGGRRLIRRLALQGIQSLPPARALEALERLVQQGATQAAVLSVDWRQYRQYAPAQGESSLFSRLAREESEASRQADGPRERRGLTREALLAVEPNQRRRLVEAYLSEQVARVLALAVTNLDVQQPLDSLGLDSLMAVEVKTRVEVELGVAVPMVRFLQGPSIAQLAAQLADQLTRETTAAGRLPRVERGLGEYPLSYGQRSMWFLNQLAPESAAYNVVFPAYIRSPVDLASLRAAFQALLDHHPVLRTTVTTHDGRPVQRIDEHATVEFTVTDASSWDRAAVDALLSAQAHRLFDLERGPMMRAHVVALSPGEHILLFVVHHIAIDFWSLVGLIDELGRVYAASQIGAPVGLPPLDFQYADFAEWQGAMMAGGEGERLWSYWRQQLAGELPALNLPTDRPRPAVQTYDGDVLDFTVDARLAGELRRLAMVSGATLNMILVAAFQVLLYRYTDQEDILLGTLATGRSRAEFEQIVGYFVNPVVLRCDLSGNPTFKTFLAQVRERVLGALEHEDMPYPLLVERLQPSRDASRSALFQVMFIMLQPRHLEQQGISEFFMGKTGARMNLGGLDLDSFSLKQRTAMFDLNLTMVEAGGVLSAHWNYNTDLFDGATIARMADHFQCLLEGIVADPERPLLELPLLTGAERHRLLVEWNETRASFPTAPVHEVFEAHAERAPEAVAVVADGKQMSYGAVNRRANRVARGLAARGVGPDVLVALLAPRDVDLLTAILAVFKAGGAYLPLDPVHPGERIAQVLQQSGASLVLTTDELAPGLRLALEKTELRTRSEVIRTLIEEEQDDENVARRGGPDDLAYVIYTSGSTGVPKGAMVERKGMLNHLYGKINALKLTAADTVAQTASQCFDISVWQLLAPLLVGGRTHIYDDDVAHDPRLLLEACDRDGVSILEMVPSLLRAMLEDVGQRAADRPPLTALRWLIPTGEALPPELCRDWLALYPGIPLMNAYGPTECSDDVAHYAVLQPPPAGQTHMPIGRPIQNMRLYVLNRRHQPVPVGVVGELYVGGIGVGRGYLNDPDRTAEAFLGDPFSPGQHARLYKTGDLARYRPDGTIEFLGRVDDQVKIRGFRIELGEVEAALNKHPAVRESVVIATDAGRGAEDRSTQTRRLVAYVVPHAGQPPPVNELRSFLKLKLASYMVPSVFVPLESLPLTANGKLNRQALPAPTADRVALERTFVAPRTPVEETLARIWCGVLGLERVGIHDNFFELGGDSIMGLQAIARAAAEGLRFTPKQLFQCQTIAELAAAANTAPPVRAEQELITGPVPLTPIQHWFLESPGPDPHHHNQAVLLEVRDRLEPSVLEVALRHLVVHHDALRLRFRRTESGWRQRIDDPDDASILSSVDLAALPAPEQRAAVEATAARTQASLDLFKGPLIRAVLFDLGADQPGRLLIVVHHLAVDAVSWRILLEDLYAGYEQASQDHTIQLPPKTTSFRYWAEQLENHARSAAVRDEVGYWLAQPWDSVSPLPVDYPEGLDANTAASARTMWLWLSPEETQSLLQEVPRAYNTHINDALLAALRQAFASWTGSETLLVDLEGHGREDLFDNVDLSRTVGWFTNLFPVLLHAGPSSDPGEALRTVKEHLRRVPSRGTGYGVLKYLDGDAEVGQKLRRLPRAEVSFTYLGQVAQLFRAGAAFAPLTESSGPLHSPSAPRRYLLDINATAVDGRLGVALTYGEGLHRRETIAALGRAFLAALQAIIAHCVAPETGGYTPSDFPDVELTQEELDAIVAGLEPHDGTPQ